MTISVFALSLLLSHLSTEPAPPDYARDSAWICRPDRTDACSTTRTAAIADSASHEPQSTPQIDCFYIYPTISIASGDNAPIEVTQSERQVVSLQLAKLSSVCRLYAPLYRQLTVSDMKRRLEGQPTPNLPQAMGMAETDVGAAWDYYLKHDNQGRGFVLIGHSQGALILQNLIRDQIEGSAHEASLVSAILPGSFVTAPKDHDVGGSFAHTPACLTQEQTGCVIAFNSFLDRAGPPSAYSEAVEKDERAICTNPAALNGTKAALNTIHAADRSTIIPWFSAPPLIGIDADAPSMQTQKLYGQCVDLDGAAYLSISDPEDYLSGFGNFIFEGERDAGMGLHLIDMELVLGDLITLIAAQGQAFEQSRNP